MHRFDDAEAVASEPAPGGVDLSDGDDASAYPPPPRPPVPMGTALDGLLSPVRLEGDTPAAADTWGRQATASPVPPPGCALLEELGRGGMGVVYKARQVDLNRLVAVKMIRAGTLASEEERLRFRAEAQAAARLSHPNIIQVHDVGETDGQAHLILEYAEGGNLAHRLTEGPLCPRDGASLIHALAQAVHYAHTCGIVHRDLKPANVLLSGEGQEARGEVQEAGEKALPSRPSPLSARPSPGLSSVVPKITDFGLAKLLNEETGQTQTGAILGTPSYMAPEQAYGRHQQVGPAADVYALGAMLYEMLTGRPPFCGPTPLDTLDQVRTHEPVPPRQLQRGIPRDLETICMKCLHKEPRRRYLSADALAGDVRRFLNGEPIQARPVGIWERGLKWVRRRPASAALTACSLVAAAALLTVGLVFHFELESALHDTRRQRDRAEIYYGKMLEAVDSLLTEVGDKDLEDIPEMEEARTRLYEKALHYYEGILSEDGPADSTNRLQRARLLYRIAWLNQWGGRAEYSEKYALRALDFCRQLVDETPGDVVFRRELARAHGVLGDTYSAMNRQTEAEAAHRRAKEIRESLPLDLPADRVALAQTCTVLATACSDDRPEEAGRLFDRAVALLEDWPSAKGAGSILAQAYLNRGALHQKHGRLAEAAAAYQKGLTAGQSALSAARWVGLAHFNVAQIQHNLAALKLAKAPEEAEKLYQSALDLCQQLTRRHPKLPRYAMELVSNHESLAHLYLRTGKAAEAERHLRNAVTLGLSGAGRPWVTPVMLARDLNALGLCYLQGQRFAEAEVELKKALPILQPLAGKSSPERMPCLTLAKTLFLLGFAEQQGDKQRQACDCYDQAIDLLERTQKTGPLDPADIAILQASQEGRKALAASHGKVKK